MKNSLSSSQSSQCTPKCSWKEQKYRLPTPVFLRAAHTLPARFTSRLKIAQYVCTDTPSVLVHSYEKVGGFPAVLFSRIPVCLPRSLAEPHPSGTAPDTPNFSYPSCAQGGGGCASLCWSCSLLGKVQECSAHQQGLAAPRGAAILGSCTVQKPPQQAAGLVCFRVKEIQDTEEKGGKERSKVVSE